jgi:hypothetical protein
MRTSLARAAAAAAAAAAAFALTIATVIAFSRVASAQTQPPPSESDAGSTVSVPVFTGGGATAASASAGGAAADIDASEAAYAAIDFERANLLAQRAAGARGLTHEQLVRAYRLLGRTSAVLGKPREAIDAFVRLLAYVPDEKADPSQTPRIQQAFSEAQGFWGSYATKPGVEATTVALRVQSQGTLRVRLHDPTHLVSRIVVGYRWGNTGPFTTAEVAPVESFNVELVPGPPQVARLDYYVLALDAADGQAFVAGDPTTPRTALAELPPAVASGAQGEGAAGAESGREGVRGERRGGKSIFASPIFWVVAGAVVVTAATSTYFALRKPVEVSLPPTQGDFTAKLLCRDTIDQRCQ